ncbi:hypothetical protein JOB18_049183 [Solea senegalensis]|uniref:Uncharacterized protein n=1 Tax=Solea senegalensis TaxID=28829 RepID=A0AAV6T2G5_SOLSE|nr:hypothetical protein JOB18_049183 [Solea senegalensis]
MLCFHLYVFTQTFGGMVLPERMGAKSQDQIFWLCGDNSWKEQTRKLLHLIKDPAGQQQSFTHRVLTRHPGSGDWCQDFWHGRLRS